MQFSIPGKRSAADYTQIGHGITDGALQGMDVSEAWKLASKSAVNYTPAALQLMFVLTNATSKRGNLRGLLLHPTRTW